jgi:hypothetical protein
MKRLSLPFHPLIHLIHYQQDQDVPLCIKSSSKLAIAFDEGVPGLPLFQL